MINHADIENIIGCKTLVTDRMQRAIEDWYDAAINGLPLDKNPETLTLNLPALICGFVCGWGWGMAVGFVLPLLRSVLFGMPPMIPTALCMAFEMAAYGAAAGLLYRFFAGRRGHIYLSLVGAMLIGRVVWGIVSFAVYALLTEKTFSLTAFWMGGFANAWPGIVLQLVLVPLIVAGLERARLIPLKQENA